MATFTMALHELLGVDTPRDADASRIGLDDYPIWDQGYRDTLNQKIVSRFWNREIGFETPDMFVHHMRTLMGEIMPYYSELAKTTVMDFDPFETVNVTSTNTAETDVATKGTTETDTATESKSEQESSSTEDGESSQTTKADNSSRNVNSDHPQTRLNDQEDYATSSADAVSASVSESDGTSSGSQRQQGTGSDTSTGSQTGATTGEQSNRHRDTSTQQGTQGSKARLLQEYRDAIVGVDVLILEELEVLFMGVWDTDQSYTRIESTYPYYNVF